jgi:hypothetical protein
MPDPTCGALYSKVGVHYPRLLLFGEREEECAKNTDLGVGGLVIAGENVSSTGPLTAPHDGMYPMNLLRG